MHKIFQHLLAGAGFIFPAFSFAADVPTQVSHGLSPAYFLKLGVALLLVLGMFIAFAWLMRRFNGYQSTAKGGLRVVTGLNLGTREKLVVVQVGEDQLLLGVTPGKIEKLHRLGSCLEENTAAVASDFSQKLKTVIQKKEK